MATKSKSVSKASPKGKMMKPAGKKGLAAVKRLGRTKKTGGFDKISAKAGKAYKSKAAGNKVAGAIYWKMAKAHGKGK